LESSAWSSAWREERARYPIAPSAKRLIAPATIPINTSIVIFVLLLAGVAILVTIGQRKVREGELFYSGTIEATQSHLAFQTGGRVRAVAAKEGQAVAMDQLLAELPDPEGVGKVSRAYHRYALDLGPPPERLRGHIRAGCAGIS